MQRVAPITTLLARRGYAAVAAMENARGGVAEVAPGMVKAAKVVAESPSAGGGKAEVFWMRDPKTGNWIPENRFGELDVAELREALLSKK